MAPNGETLVASYTRSGLDRPQKPRRISMEGLQRAISDFRGRSLTSQRAISEASEDLDGGPSEGLDRPQKPRRISMEGLQRAISDFSFELSKEGIGTKLPPISEVEDAKCECCGMSEECTPAYIRRVREKFSGTWICGLCSEAVKEEMEKNGGRQDEALNTHMSVCVRFNRIGRTHPVLFQAEAMREILRKSRLDGRGARGKSNSPRERGSMTSGGITRSSSCISAITKEINGRAIVN